MTKISLSYTSASIQKLDGSRIEITGSVAPEIWKAHRGAALKHINETITIDGFRKGMIPENILVSKVGESTILEEIAELAVSRAYIDILVAEKIDAIGKPEIRVTKLAVDNPIEFVATTQVVPEVTLPDYTKIAHEQIGTADPEELKVVEKDITDAIDKIRRRSVSHDGHNHENMTHEEHEKAITDAMPELTDEFVKGLGDFTDVPDFKNKLSDMIAEQKRDAAKEKTRMRIADALSDATTIIIPDLMIQSEMERTEAQFSADIERMGIKMDDYLKHAKKTIEELHTEWKPHAEKKAKLQLVLNAIAVKENIKPDQKEIEEEVNHIVEHYADADRERAAVYAETVLTNEKVFAFLESKGK